MKTCAANNLAMSLLFVFCMALCAPANPSGAQSPAVTAKPTETKTTESKPFDSRSLSEITLEHSRIRDDLLAAEARLSLISEKVFGSQLIVHFKGTIDTPFHLAVLELELDRQQVYRQEFSDSATAQYLKVFDSFVPPGRHLLQLRVWARGPEETLEMAPSYFAGSGMAVVVAQKGTCSVLFKADQDGDVPDSRKIQKGGDLEGQWDIDISSEYQTQSR